jgi:hypothetical protein
MESLPKVVESQLKKDLRISLEPHPDADLLTAFSEQTLKDSERAVLLTHLSQCSECRDVVFLSVPPQEAQAVQIRKVFSWRPVLAWSGVAACALIVGSVALIKHESQHERLEAYVKQEAPAMVMQKASSPEPIQPNTTANAPANANESYLPLKKETAPLMAMQAKPASPASKDFSNARDASRASGTPSVAAMQPRAAEPVARPAAEPAQEAREKDKFEANAIMASANAPQSATAPQSLTTSQLSEARAASAPSANGMQPVGGNVPDPMKESFADTSTGTSAAKGMIANAKIDDRSPRWTLNSDGTLLRSLDTGASWRKILIPGNQATLHTIATVGADVWVGGTEGAVYHSKDAGGHWMPIPLTDDGKPLSDDVISIKFVSPQQGAILTDRQTVWATNDGGQTWHKK